jgi:glycerophosphoryl diester phosphodiesterase
MQNWSQKASQKVSQKVREAGLEPGADQEARNIRKIGKRNYSMPNLNAMDSREENKTVVSEEEEGEVAGCKEAQSGFLNVPTLKELFADLPPGLGLNIEVKYPVEKAVEWLSFTSFYEINAYIDTILVILILPLRPRRGTLLSLNLTRIRSDNNPNSPD